MKISVIIVTFNCENFLEETIESVLKQSYENYEIFIVDGNSNDKTLDIIKKYSKEDNIRYISEPDKGIYDAMNKGLEKIEGEIVYFLNAKDTIYNADVFQKVINSFICNDTDLVFGKVDLCFENGRKVLRKQYLLNYAVTVIVKGICHQSIFAKKELFSEIGSFCLNYKLTADSNWIVKCFLAKKKFKFIDFIIASYDMGGISNSLSSFFESDQYMLTLLKGKYKFLYYLKRTYKYMLIKSKKTNRS